MGGIASCVRSSSLNNDKMQSYPGTLELSSRQGGVSKIVAKIPTKPTTSDEDSNQLHLQSTNNTENDSKPNNNNPNEQIFILCEKGTLQTIEFIVSNYPDTTQRINDRYPCRVKGVILQITALQLAAACGHDDVVKYLLSITTIEPNISDPMYLMTALHLAVFYEHVACIEVLCKDFRVDLSERNVDGKSALHVAIEKGSIAAVECILRLRPMLDFKLKDFDGNTVLHSTALYPSERILYLLIQYIENQKRMLRNNTTDDLYPSPLSLRKWKYMYEVTNFQGETPMQVLKRNIELFEARRIAWESNNNNNNAERKEEINSVTTMFPHRISWDTKLQTMKVCLQMLQQCTHVDAETLSSFGGHSSPSAEDLLLVEEDGIVGGGGMKKSDQEHPHVIMANYSTHSSEDSGITAVAFSWSPQNEKLIQQLIQDESNVQSSSSSLHCM